MAITLDRFDGGEVDFLSARDLGDNQFQIMRNMRGDRITRATKSDAVQGGLGNRSNSFTLPGQGFIQYRAEWNNLATPTQTSMVYGVAAVIVNSVGAWEINIARRDALVTSAWETEFIDETSAKGGWERATSNRLVQGSSNITFTASTDRISGNANLANFEVGEVIRVMNTTDNNGYYVVKTKEPAANSVDVHEALTDEASVSAYLYPLPIISMFAVNGNLRVSNGNFVDDHDSQWYGHIKRDFWGQGVTYGSNGGRFEQPVMTEAYNNWKLQNQELVAPTIIVGARTGQATTAANQVAIHIAGAHHEFKELMPNSIDRTFAGGGTAWANVDIGTTFDETTDLSLAASAADQYCTCPVASAPMTAGRKYRLQFDVANLISTFTIQDFTGVQELGKVYANGKEQPTMFTVDTGITGGYRIVADTDDASADFDNFSLSAIEWPEKAVDVEWNPRDRVTATYVYDHVQESALGRSSSGEIGIEMGIAGHYSYVGGYYYTGQTWHPASDNQARGFMAEVYTGAAQASWNRRITAIRLYYKFHNDPDWYEIVTLDVNKGWSESELIFKDENTGYWVPMVDANGMDHTGNIATGSGTTINDVAHGVLATDVLYVGNTISIQPDSMITKPASVVADVITLPVAMVDSLGINAASYALLDWCAGDESATAVGTFYIPFTGEKAFSYFTNTGRAAKVKVPAIRWAACDTDGSKVLYGNIDTKDENDQTLRERTRIIESPEGMPDTALLSKSKDVGTCSGDEIVSIKYYNRAWWVIMERSVVVLEPRTLRELARYNGVGSKWTHANVLTPYGLCVADQAGVTLLPSREELSFPRRNSYQLLTFFQKTTGPTLSYSTKKKAIYFMPNPGDTDEDSVVLWKYSFETKSWSREDLSTAEDGLYGNPVSIGRYRLTVSHSMADNEPEYLKEGSTTQNVSTIQLNIGNGSGITGELKTKEYDYDKPYNDKIYGSGYLSYSTSSIAVTVKVYLDGNTIPAKTMQFDATGAVFVNVEVSLNVTCKLLSLSFSSTDANFEIEDFIIPDEEITVLDR